MGDFRREIANMAVDAVEVIISDVSRWIRLGHQAETDCSVYGLAAFQRIDGKIVRVDPAKVRFQVIDPTSRRSDRSDRHTEAVLDWLSEDDPPHRELTDAEERAEEATWD